MSVRGWKVAGVGGHTHVMKNCEPSAGISYHSMPTRREEHREGLVGHSPFVFGPLLAIARIPAPTNLKSG